jgi:polyhydroxyalkanoate synthesis regulator phasin
MTIDELARMVQDGFSESKNHADEQFAEVHRELKAIRKELLGVVYRPEFDDLQERVHELEDLLSGLRKKAA